MVPRLLHSGKKETEPKRSQQAQKRSPERAQRSRRDPKWSQHCSWEPPVNPPGTPTGEGRRPKVIRATFRRHLGHPSGPHRTSLEALGDRKKVIFAKQLLPRNTFLLLSSARVSTAVFYRFGDVLLSVLEPSDLQDSMVFIVFRALPYFSGKVRNRSSKKISKWAFGGA